MGGSIESGGSSSIAAIINLLDDCYVFLSYLSNANLLNINCTSKRRHLN